MHPDSKAKGKKIVVNGAAYDSEKIHRANFKDVGTKNKVVVKVALKKSIHDCGHKSESFWQKAFI